MKELSHKEIQNIRKSGLILKQTVSKILKLIKPGISAKYIDKMVEMEIRSNDAVPSFLNFKTENGMYPASVCVSLNDEVVHGIPSEEKIIKEGDLLSLDLGCSYMGMCTDYAISLIVGKNYDKNLDKLIKATKISLENGIKMARIGNTTGDIGNAIENTAKTFGFSVVKNLVGHGVGRSPHEEPQIPNFGIPKEGSSIIKNYAYAIEPMLVMGKGDIKVDKDGWTVKTSDGSLSAHFEHTILVAKKGVEVLT